MIQSSFHSSIGKLCHLGTIIDNHDWYFAFYRLGDLVFDVIKNFQQRLHCNRSVRDGQAAGRFYHFLVQQRTFFSVF